MLILCQFGIKRIEKPSIKFDLATNATTYSEHSNLGRYITLFGVPVKVHFHGRFWVGVSHRIYSNILKI